MMKNPVATLQHVQAPKDWNLDVFTLRTCPTNTRILKLIHTPDFFNVRGCSILGRAIISRTHISRNHLIDKTVTSKNPYQLRC